MTARKLTPAEALECLRDWCNLCMSDFDRKWGEHKPGQMVDIAVTSLEEALAQKPPAVVDMNVCEIDHLFLNTGVLYRFRRAEGCDACASYGKRSDKPAAPVPSDEEIVDAIESARLIYGQTMGTRALRLLARRIGVQGVPQ